MSQKVILANREDVRNIENEEKQRFVMDVLYQTGLPEEQLEDIFTEESLAQGFTPAEKIKLRSICEKFSITIIDDLDGGVKIYCLVSDKLVLMGEWKKCHFVLRTAPGEIDPKKRYYTEVHCEWWTTFDKKDNNGKA